MGHRHLRILELTLCNCKSWWWHPLVHICTCQGQKNFMCVVSVWHGTAVGLSPYIMTTAYNSLLFTLGLSTPHHLPQWNPNCFWKLQGDNHKQLNSDWFYHNTISAQVCRANLWVEYTCREGNRLYLPSLEPPVYSATDVNSKQDSISCWYCEFILPLELH